MQHIENYFNNLDQIIDKKIYFLRLDNNMSQAELTKKNWYLHNNYKNMKTLKIELAQHDYP